MITEINKGSVVTTSMIARARSIAKTHLAYTKKDAQPIDVTGEEAKLLCEVVTALTQPEASDPHDLEGDSLMGAFPNGLEYLTKIAAICDDDAVKILVADKAYGGSWQKRGGVGAFMMLARKWDRMENRVMSQGGDVFVAIQKDTRREGVIDDVRDLRRYLTLVEAVAQYRGLVPLEKGSKESDK